MKIAYFDCFSGISGDMVLGALLDLGAPLERLREELSRLPLKGYTLEVTRERRGSLCGTRVRITCEPQPPRDYASIRELIGGSALDPWVKETSLAIFQRLAEAEARVHGVPLSHVHFHEVGALDSILDVVGAAAALRLLDVETVAASALPMGRGFVETDHGRLPVPAPATVILLSGVPVYDNGVQRELVTPTGAAILATLARSYGRLPEMTLEAAGYGVGTHAQANPPNVLRVLLGRDTANLRHRSLLLMETNIDDMNPEIYNYLLEKLLAVGALDVNLIPMQMKKGRPAVLLRVLAERALREGLLDVLFSETTTLGVRTLDVERIELPREERQIETPLGFCRVKAVRLPSGRERLIPEYEECRQLALARGLPLLRVYEEVAAAAHSVSASSHE